jgi:hypothetical protein
MFPQLRLTMNLRETMVLMVLHQAVMLPQPNIVPLELIHIMSTLFCCLKHFLLVNLLLTMKLQLLLIQNPCMRLQLTLLVQLGYIYSLTSLL